jgi:1-aminocyclopropane-1-carboxylate deaminase
MQTPNTFIDHIELPNGLSFDLMRLDQTDSLISGNKWFKLLPNLSDLPKGTCIASFGGPHSNHIHALAWSANQMGLKSVGFIRGEPQFTPTLDDALSWGMKLIFIDRGTYRSKPTQQLADKYQLASPIWIPEGGSNTNAVRGCATIWQQEALQGQNYDELYVAVGSGGTLAGLVTGAPEGGRLIGLSALGSKADLEERVSDLIDQTSPETHFDNWVIEVALEQRYGKVTPELAATHKRAESLGIELDPIYTLRVFHHLIRKQLARELEGKRILMIHTGGLQGLRAQQERINRLALEFVGPLPF